MVFIDATASLMFVMLCCIILVVELPLFFQSVFASLGLCYFDSYSSACFLLGLEFVFALLCWAVNKLSIIQSYLRMLLPTHPCHDT